MNIELLKRLCTVSAPSGNEYEAAELIRAELSECGANIKQDRMDNIIVPMHFGDINASDRVRIMVSAHMDEVGFMITEIKKEGYLGFGCVGGISASVLSGRRVKVLAKGGALTGVIASKAIHHKDKKEEGKLPKKDKLYIDIGATSAEQAEGCVRIGDFAVFESDFYELGEGLVKARAIDDRAGCGAMTEIIRSLTEEPINGNADVYFCFTVREEIGLSGAAVAAQVIKPHIAIVLESTAVADIEGVKDSQRVARLSGGVCISVMDRSTIYDKQLVGRALELAAEKGISAQLKKYVSGGNDAGSIHKSGKGVRTLALSVPTRYLHSASCVASTADIESQKMLCEAIVREGMRLTFLREEK